MRRSAEQRELAAGGGVKDVMHEHELSMSRELLARPSLWTRLRRKWYAADTGGPTCFLLAAASEALMIEWISALVPVRAHAAITSRDRSPASPCVPPRIGHVSWRRIA
jgi:hypothetical protein